MGLLLFLLFSPGAAGASVTSELAGAAKTPAGAPFDAARPRGGDSPAVVSSSWEKRVRALHTQWPPGHRRRCAMSPPPWPAQPHPPSPSPPPQARAGRSKCAELHNQGRCSRGEHSFSHAGSSITPAAGAVVSHSASSATTVVHSTGAIASTVAGATHAVSNRNRSVTTATSQVTGAVVSPVRATVGAGPSCERPPRGGRGDGDSCSHLARREGDAPVLIDEHLADCRTSPSPGGDIDVGLWSAAAEPTALPGEDRWNGKQLRWPGQPLREGRGRHEELTLRH